MLVVTVGLYNCKKEDPYLPPTLTTVAATDITINAAQVGINVTALGTGTVSDYGVVYATTDNPTTTSGTKISLGSTLISTTTANAPLTGLTPGTMYYVRAYVRNEKDTYYGSSISFSTGALKVGATTSGVATSVTNNSMVVTGKITDLGTGGVTNYGHCMSETNQMPTIADSKSELGVLTTAPIDFTSSFGSLKSSTNYYVRAYVTNNAGTAYGDVVGVTTTNLIAPTGVTSSSVGSILSTSAKVNGTITSPGSSSITAYGHVWSDTKNLPTVDDSKTTLTAAGNFPLSYGSDLTNLKTNTTYFVRAYATSVAGTTYSTATSFKTSNTADELTTFKDIKFTLARGNAYSSNDQLAFVELTTGKVFKMSEGTANATKIDLIVWLSANMTKISSTVNDAVEFVSPSTALDYNIYWGDFPTKLIAQNWSIYKATKLNYLSVTSYPAATWWGRINTTTDLTSIVGMLNIAPSRQDAVRNDGTVNDNRVYVFQTREGKYGVMRVTDGTKKANEFTVTFDIKVQK